MTARKSQRSFASPRALPTRFTTTVCALLLSLTPLAAQQSSTPSGGQGPVLSSSEIAQGAILLHFTHAEGGLRLKDSGRNSFEIAGADHTWFPADAHLVNGVVVVSTSLVQQPTAVRYTWSTSAAATLFNGEGLPAAPFRTDQ
jgi:hypothetical protein